MNSLNHTVDQFLLLAQHPEKEHFLVHSSMRNPGLIGAILFDLSEAEAINIEEGKLIVNTAEIKLPLPHQQVLQIIQESKKVRKIKRWISKLSIRASGYQKSLLQELHHKGIIEIVPKKFLFLHYYRTRLVNTTVRAELIEELREIIFNDQPDNNIMHPLLGLIEACKMHKSICNNRAEIKQCQRQVKVLLESNTITRGVDRVIKDMQAAIIAATVASTTAAIATSNS